MIKRDISYIFKRIIIGIGIILGISFIRSCNVYALDNDYYNFKSVDINYKKYHSVGDKYHYNICNGSYDVEYKSDGLYVNTTKIVSKGGQWLSNAWVIGCWPNSSNMSFYYLYTSISGYSIGSVGFNGVNGKTIPEIPFTTSSMGVSGGLAPAYRIRANFNNGSFVSQNTSQMGSCGSVPNPNTGVGVCFLSGYNFDVYGSNQRMDFRDTTTGSTNYFYSSNFSSPVYNIPEIVSLNPRLNKTDDNMLVSVSFSLEFSYIDTENYNYYAWFEGYDKMKITLNNVVLNTQQNTTLYVEITDKQGNSIDTETYTVSSIGLIYNGDYDIQFITNEYTASDTTNNSDLLIDTINRIDIDITYIPKWINYTYQYQYVESGNSLTNNWTTVNNDNADNNVVVSVYSNGKMYARILDSNNNVLKSSDYEVTRIGELKTYDNNSNKIFSMFNKINNDINFGGPVSNLITIPVNVIETILQAGSNMCTPYYLGTINGHALSLTCIDPEDYLGSALWSTIDIIVSGCMIYSIFKWLTSLYWSFVILSDTPDIDADKFGDRRDLK